jgi:type III secretion system YscJ/HrcJ family lipoprotein
MRRWAPMLGIPLLVSCSAPLLDKASDEDANHALSVLDRHGIAAEKHLQRDGAWQVDVAADSLPAAAGLAHAYGLPARPRQSLAQLFGEKAFISTPGEEQVRLLIGLNHDVAAALEHIDGVLHADVQLGLPRALQRDSLPVPQSASVLIRHDSAEDLPATRESIRRFVADAAGGLDSSQVSVVFVAVTPDAVLVSRSAAHVVLGLATLAVAFGAQLRAWRWPHGWPVFWRRAQRSPASMSTGSIPPRAGQAARAKADT